MQHAFGPASVLGNYLQYAGGEPGVPSFQAIGRELPAGQGNAVQAGSLGRALPAGPPGTPNHAVPLGRALPSTKKTVWTPFGNTDIVPGVDTTPPFPSSERKDVPMGYDKQSIFSQEEQGRNTEKETQQERDGDMSRVKPKAARQPRSVARNRKGRQSRAGYTADIETGPEDDEYSFIPKAITDRRRSDTEKAMQRLRVMDGDGEGVQPRSKRLGRSIYDAVQTHGHFGMVDSGESSNGIRRVVVHVPKTSRGYVLDIHPGEVIYANSGRGRPISGRLDVQYVTRHQYFAPGRPVTSCVIGVPEEQWHKFLG